MDDIYPEDFYEEDKKYYNKIIILLLIIDLAIFGAIIYLINFFGCMKLQWTILVGILVYLLLYILLTFTNPFISILMTLPFASKI